MSCNVTLTLSKQQWCSFSSQLEWSKLGELNGQEMILFYARTLGKSKTISKPFKTTRKLVKHGGMWTPPFLNGQRHLSTASVALSSG